MLEHRRIRTLAGAVVALLPSPSLAQSAPGGTTPETPPATILPPVAVIATSPLPGLGIDRDKVPSNAQSLPAPDITIQRGQHRSRPSSTSGSAASISKTIR